MPIPSSCIRLSGLALWLFAAAALAAEGPAIISRADWGAKAPIAKMKQHKPVAILVHHTGSKMKPKLGVAAKMKGLQRFSQSAEKLADGRMKPAWPDVPYHFYIAADGKIAEGRDINAVGDTNTGYNPQGYIQVVVEGNFEVEKVAAPQLESLKLLLASLKKAHGITAQNVLGHSDKAQTACPGKNLEALIGDVAAD
jgi:N-acetylmuramoyl-L-alanine amidase